MTKPLVTVGVPVRNGAATLARALDNVLSQTHENLRVVISDNGSTDDTARISQEFAERDPRVAYFLQDPPLPPIKNFEFTFRQARSPYFMWAAHDDLRSDNFIEVLVRELEERPTASFATGAISLVEDLDDLGSRRVLDYPGATCGFGLLQILRRRVRCLCFEIYGVFRTATLEDCPFDHFDAGPDWPIVCHALIKGDLVQTPSADFLYFIGKPGQKEERAHENVFRKIPRLKHLRLAFRIWWSAGRAFGRSRHPRRLGHALVIPLAMTLRLSWAAWHETLRRIAAWGRTSLSR